MGNWLGGPLHCQCWTRQGDTVPDGRAGSVSRRPRSWSPGPSLLAAEPAPEAARLRHLRVCLVPQDAGLVGGALGETGESGHLPALELHLRRCPRRVPVPRLVPRLRCSPETAFAEEKLRPRAGKGLVQPPAHCPASGTPVPSLGGAGQQRPIPLNTKWPLGGSGAQTGLGKHSCPTGCGVITGGLLPDEGGARHREAGHGPAPDDAARPGWRAGRVWAGSRWSRVSQARQRARGGERGGPAGGTWQRMAPSSPRSSWPGRAREQQPRTRVRLGCIRLLQSLPVTLGKSLKLCQPLSPPTARG